MYMAQGKSQTKSEYPNGGGVGGVGNRQFMN